MHTFAVYVNFLEQCLVLPTSYPCTQATSGSPSKALTSPEIAVAGALGNMTSLAGREASVPLCSGFS